MRDKIHEIDKKVDVIINELKHIKALKPRVIELEKAKNIIYGIGIFIFSSGMLSLIITYLVSLQNSI